MAFELLSQHDFPTACAMFCAALKGIARRAGDPEAYHETITIAFLALIAERRACCRNADFDTFLGADPELLDKTVIQRWYAPKRLGSAMARATFVLPEAVR